VINVADVERALAHYQKVLGAPSQRNADGVWFQTGTSRIGLTPVSSGQKPGVRYICISAANFAPEKMIPALQQSGVAIEPAAGSNSIRFRDPDGLLIQILAAPK
jgi:catechol 2,3-dioxygenase-like lactoylglutathione lyase family enzyme